METAAAASSEVAEGAAAGITSISIIDH